MPVRAAAREGGRSLLAAGAGIVIGCGVFAVRGSFEILTLCALYDKAMDMRRLIVTGSKPQNQHSQKQQNE